MGRGEPSDGADQRPGKPPGSRRLTILIFVMAGVTVLAGLYSVIETLVFNFSYIDTTPTLADVREHERTIRLFWPALLMTAILWLWKCMTESSRLRLVAFALTMIALLGVTRTTIRTVADTGESLVVRTWSCPPGLSAYDIPTREQACTKLPFDAVDWFIIEGEPIRGMLPSSYLEPSTREDNISTWEGLPDGRYAFYLVTDASVERYEHVALAFPRASGTWGGPDFMYVSPGANEMWTGRIESNAWAQGIDVYFIMAPEGVSRARSSARGAGSRISGTTTDCLRDTQAVRIVRIAITSDAASSARSMIG